MKTGDIQDIETIIKKCNVKAEEVKSRAMLVLQTFVGREKDSLYNLQIVIGKFFNKGRRRHRRSP